MRVVPGKISSKIHAEVHPRRHLSDIVTVYFLNTYGKEKYTRPADAGDRTVMIGRGGYDEHSEPKLHECEATLVAKDLGIASLPELQLILDYTLKVDRFGQAKGVLKLGRVTELMHDVYPDQPWRVDQWARLVIEASIEFAKAKTPDPVDPELTRYFIKDGYEQVRGEFIPEVCQYLERMLGRVLSDPDPFSLPHCVELLWQKFRKLPARPTPVEWIKDAFRAELTRQRLFLAALEDAANARLFPLNIRKEEVKAGVISSDKEMVHTALFHLDEQVVIVAVRRSNGHVQIFRRHRASVAIKQDYTAAYLRFLEQKKRDQAVLQWSELVAQKEPAGAEYWFYHHATQNIFNGSRTAPDVEPTQLTDEEIETAITFGLDDSYREEREKFRKERGG